MPKGNEMNSEKTLISIVIGNREVITLNTGRLGRILTEVPHSPSNKMPRRKYKYWTPIGLSKCIFFSKISTMYGGSSGLSKILCGISLMTKNEILTIINRVMNIATIRPAIYFAIVTSPKSPCLNRVLAQF